MGKRFSSLCALGLAGLLSLSSPAAAQEPLVAQAVHREVPTRTLSDAAITVGAR